MKVATHQSTVRNARRTALLALFGISALAAGPGAVIASLALLAGDHADHRVSMQRDLGHEDIVICHDGERDETRTPALRDADDCRDDHRLHVASDDGVVARDDTQSALGSAGSVAVGVVAPPVPVRRVVPPSAAAGSRAREMAARLQRSVVLQV